MVRFNCHMTLRDLLYCLTQNTNEASCILFLLLEIRVLFVIQKQIQASAERKKVENLQFKELASDGRALS